MNTLWKAYPVELVTSYMQRPTMGKKNKRKVLISNSFLFKIVFLFAHFSRIGTGDASDILNTRTKGTKPSVPNAQKFIEVSPTSVTLHLSSWDDGKMTENNVIH